MATWVGAPSPAVVASTGTHEGAGRFALGQNLGTVGQQPPSPPFRPAPGAFSLTNNTTGYAI